MKRQTVILVTIGVVLFIAGGAIAFLSVVHGNKNKTPDAVTTASTPVVVAKAAIPTGTTGQAMVAQGLVVIQSVPAKEFNPADLTTLAGLTNVVTTSAVAKGHAVLATQLAASTTAISLPPGLDAVTVSMSGVNGLAGYLQPGSQVDVYAYVSKLSTATTATQTATSSIPLPCTELAMTDVEVLDVQVTVPALSTKPTALGRTIPTTETVLMAVTPDEAREVSFLSQIATLSVAQTQKGTVPPVIGQCIGTAQTTGAA